MNLFPSQESGVAWWVEINTAVPHCTYYFGPFDSEKEAQLYRTGYVEDLYSEEARGIVALVKQCQPDVLTIFHEEAKVKIFSF
ncbi:DUF1816 domain-containing protein [Anabaena sphaerica FACHB-251]|uniref:DUF1816 domain-containing protein n=1 Tax=Anabaena sphaerica FACHB-251 TaxID=2692883 RepID=A0A926WH06_9NOST|nr:DUF1816 domain-containing protein [Anabaena sphaerica]MBD2294342.1 DUF1816 domain-containing protein [Anabaena sphaerica FACHB-251]